MTGGSRLPPVHRRPGGLGDGFDGFLLLHGSLGPSWGIAVSRRTPTRPSFSPRGLGWWVVSAEEEKQGVMICNTPPPLCPVCVLVEEEEEGEEDLPRWCTG